MITREQVADLQPGDVVEIRDERYPGFLLSGPVHEDHTELAIGPVLLRYSNGEPMRGNVRTLTVVSRAARLYVNHPRTEPVPGDVVGDADEREGQWSFAPIRSVPDYPWQSTRNCHRRSRADLPARLRLLVDGETGRCVP